MRWTSALAIFFLFWVMSAFFVMPFGLRTLEEEGVEKVPGQVDSAPANFNPKRIAKRATVLAVIFFTVFYINYVENWITPEDIDITGGAPDLYTSTPSPSPSS